MKRVALYLVGFLCFSLSGCVWLRQPALVRDADVTTYDGLSARYAADASALAGQAVEELVRRYPPGHTRLYLVKAPGAFGDDLETGLRRQGFAVLPADDAGMAMGYVLDEVSGEVAPTGYVQVSVSDGTKFGFVRPLGMATAPPSSGQLPPSPMSVTPLGPSQEKNAVSPEFTAASASLSALPSLESNSREEAALALVPSTGGQDKPLRLAVLSHLPPAWRYTIPDASKREIRVSWPEDASWRSAISVAARQAGCRAEFDEDARRVRVVTVSAAVPASSAAPDIVENADAGQAVPATLLDAQATMTPDEPESPLVLSPMPARDEWSLSPGSLCAQLQTWADRGGYQLVWKASHDLDMEARANFRGGFLEALRQLFQGLHKSGNALRVTIYTANNVIEIAED